MPGTAPFRAVGSLAGGRSALMKARAYLSKNPYCVRCAADRRSTKADVVRSDAFHKRTDALCLACSTELNPGSSSIYAKMRAVRDAVKARPRCDRCGANKDIEVSAGVSLGREGGALCKKCKSIANPQPPWPKPLSEAIRDARRNRTK